MSVIRKPNKLGDSEVYLGDELIGAVNFITNKYKSMDGKISGDVKQRNIAVKELVKHHRSNI